MEPLVGLRFVLERGSFVQVVETLSEAKRIIQLWMENPNLSTRFGRNNPPPGGQPWMAWSVDTKAIQAIHTVPMEQTPGVQTIGSVDKPWRHTSGG